MRKQRHERHFSVGLFLYLRRLQNTKRVAHCTFPSCKLCFTTLILTPTLWPLACTHTRNKTKFAFGTSAPARVQNVLYLLLCLNRQRLLNTSLWRTRIFFTGVVISNKKKFQKCVCTRNVRNYTNSEQKDTKASHKC